MKSNVKKVVIGTILMGLFDITKDFILADNLAVSIIASAVSITILGLIALNERKS